ncbi:hypothetical protein EIP91_001152 [Steccherinum ochraceum]|uniref:Acyl-CoA dehydrogenase NM domain-like protein n=1 Tax=Steccherinum ochraceum TaxID=92696 RepID=A0A4R0RKX1_9APHY|nr:hypothetical protein EIP91_001152 [Steccherinum ochraceum]
MHAAHERAEISYQRARAIARAYGLTAQDIVFLKSKFWALHADPICSMDGAAATLLTTQFNLVAGTLAPFAFQRPELEPLLQQVLDFEVSAHFLLTEIGHDLDSPNLQTTATLLSSGEFDLHTPSPQAAKWTSPTYPVGCLPRVGIVIAQLIIAGENFGVRPFVVALGDGRKMCSGVQLRSVPARNGAPNADHSMISFTNVRLPFQALLGTLDMPRNLRHNFLSVIWRVGVGSLTSSNLAIAAFRASVYAAGRYSLRRKVVADNGKLKPVMAFRPQQIPVMHALAQAAVLGAFGGLAARQFINPRVDSRVKHGVAATLKTIMTLHCQDSLHVLARRCNSQGLFEYNQILEAQLEMRGTALAEGDVLALCIRLASELLTGRYELPSPSDPSSFLARHEAGLFDEARAVIIQLDADKTSTSCEPFNRLVLPLCQPLIEAIGHRMAYEAAVRANVDSDLIALYVAGALKHDPSWYVEHLGITRRQIAEMEDRALGVAVPRVEGLLEGMGMRKYCTTPIVSDEAWEGFIEGLEVFEGDAAVSVIPGTHQAAASESPFSRL